MTSHPDGEFKWILHARDHFTKFSWTYALTSKKASWVAEKLTKLFCTFGPAKILQSDNGKEFVAKVKLKLPTCGQDWLSSEVDLNILRVRVIERGNGDLQLNLANG